MDAKEKEEAGATVGEESFLVEAVLGMKGEKVVATGRVGGAEEGGRDGLVVGMEEKELCTELAEEEELNDDEEKVVETGMDGSCF